MRALTDRFALQTFVSDSKRIVHTRTGGRTDGWTDQCKQTPVSADPHPYVGSKISPELFFFYLLLDRPTDRPHDDNLLNSFSSSSSSSSFEMFQKKVENLRQSRRAVNLILIVNLELWFILLELGSKKEKRRGENVPYCRVLASLSNRLNHFLFQFLLILLYFLFFFIAVDKFMNQQVKLALSIPLASAYAVSGTVDWSID